MEEEVDFLKLSIEERCQHKLWKARVSGYEEIIKLFAEQDDEKSPEFTKYGGLIKKFVVDNNAMAQEKGIQAAIVYAENAACAGKICSEVVSGIITKGLAASRTKTRELSLELILMYVEVDKQETVEDELIKGFENKSPKVVAACIAALREALHTFGSQVIAVKPLIKVLPKLLEDRDKMVREESKRLCAEIFRWTGNGIRTQFKELKSATIADLENEFQKVKEPPVPTRYLKSQQEKIAKTLPDDAAESLEVKNVVSEIDLFNTMVSVDVLSKLRKDFYELCEAKKWQERKEALEDLQKLTTDVRLEPGEYGELVRTLKKIISKDTNVVVVSLACKCLTNLVLGLKKKFQPYCNQCVPVIYEKFKEKKQNVVQALRECIDAMYSISSLENFLEDIQTALSNKNPQIKAETAASLTRCFSKSSAIQTNKKILKPLCFALVKTLSDTDSIVRDNSAEALGTALKVVGKNAVTPFLKDIEKDSLKMAKINEFSEKANLSAGVIIIDNEKQPSVSEKITVIKSKPIVKPEVNISGNSIASSTVTFPKKPTTGTAIKIKTTTVKQVKGGGMSKKPVVLPGDAPEPEFVEKDLSEEDVITQASSILPADVISGLNNSNWKERLSAAEKFHEAVQKTDKSNIPAQALVKLLAKKPGFKENNFQILKLRFEILTYIADNSRISRCTTDCCLSDIVDKIGDIKTGSNAGAALSSFAAALSLEYISLEVLKFAFAQKNPRNQAEALIWLSSAIKQFGIKIPLKDVVDYLKRAFSSTNPNVKTAALTLVGTLYMYLGKQLRGLFEDEKPALLQLIDAEIEKVKDTKPPSSEESLKSQNGISVEAVNIAPVNLADLMPTVDISNQITPQILSGLADKDWHLRLDALTKISGIINDAKFITPNLGDLPTILKPRLTDTNKKLATQTLSVCQALGTALGPQCSKQLRNFSPGILAALGDSKANVRAAAVQCLNSWMENCPLSCLFEGEVVSDALKTDNPFLRIELFSWLKENMTATSTISSHDLSICLPSLYSCFEDRNADVRKGASECFLPFMIHLGYEQMARASSKLKPTSAKTIMSHLEKTKGYLPEKPSKQKPSKGIPSINGRGSPPSPVGGTDDDIGNIPAVKGKLSRSTSKTKLSSKTIGSTLKSKKEEEIDVSPALVTNNLKDQRIVDERTLKTLKWNFQTPREEFYTLLKDMMKNANWGGTIVSYCFHNDFKFHLKAIDILIEYLNGNNLDATKANLDLILKWLALRFFDTNPSVLMKGLEYLQMLFEILNNDGYRMIEIEASSFIPYLVLKIGDPKDTVRSGVKEIIKLMNKIYPSSKLFAFIMQGLSSKNARMRTECLDQLGYMIEAFGINVCQPNPSVALKEIARHIADRDNTVRSAGLECVTKVYFIEGEKVFKYIGNLSEKDKSLLDQRIKQKRKDKSLNKNKEASNENFSPNQQTPRASPPINLVQHRHDDLENKPVKSTRRPQSKGPLTLQVDDIEQMFDCYKETAVPIPDPILVNADEVLNLPDIQLPPTRLRPPASAVKLLNNSAEAETAVNLVISQLTVQDIPVVVEAFAQVEELLRQDDRAEALLGSRVDQLLVMSSVQYRFAHNKHMGDENICKADVIRLYRCVTMALVSLFDHPTLAKRASRDVLRDLIPHLVTVILDNRLNELQEGPQLVRTINLLIIRILQRSDPTNVMSALIKLLHDCVQNNSIDRFTDLIMKCLWKMIRMIQQYIDEINIDRILLDLHVFLRTFPSSSWKERPTDTPIRTVKTILFTLVDILGENVLRHLTLIPNKHDSDLYSYLQKLLKLRKEKGARSSSSAKSSHNENSEDKESMRRSKSASLKLSKSTHEALTEIFKKIGCKEQTKDGLHELYDFTNNHPEANIEPFLQRSSDFFQNYIRQGLREIENERKGIGKSSLDSPDVVPKGADSPRILDNNNDIFIKKFTYEQTNDNEKGNTESWRDTFPQLPPYSADVTPSDLGEWLKVVVARMGLDITMCNNSEVMNGILGIKPGIDEELYSEEEMKNLMALVQEHKDRIDGIINQYNTTS